MLRFLATSAVFVIVVGAIDAKQGSLPWQVFVGVLTWVFVAGALFRASSQERLQVLTMIGVATLFECFGSLIWRPYEYRLGNLPLFVPPGHGLFYLAALRAASLPLLRRRAVLIVPAVLIVSGLWAVKGVLLSPTPDKLGFYCWFMLVAFLLKGRDPLFFAISFVATMALEYYGTFLGIWRWADALPVLGTLAANPPSAIGAGYCVIDATTQLCLPRTLWLAERIKSFRLPEALRSASKPANN